MRKQCLPASTGQDRSRSLSVMLPCGLVMKKLSLSQVASWPGMQASIFNLSQQKRELEESVAQGFDSRSHSWPTHLGEVLSSIAVWSSDHCPKPRSAGYQPHRGTPSAHAEGDQRSENAPLLNMVQTRSVSCQTPLRRLTYA